jgi:hypothetical protein
VEPQYFNAASGPALGKKLMPVPVPSLLIIAEANIRCTGINLGNESVSGELIFNIYVYLCLQLNQIKI